MPSANFKKVLLISAALLLLSACAGKKPEAPKIDYKRPTGAPNITLPNVPPAQ